MHEIRVLFSANDDGSFRLRLTDGDAEPLGVPCEFTPLMDDGDFEDLRWYLEVFMDLPDGGAVTRAASVEQQLDQWSRQLYEAVFRPDENRQALRQLLDAPEPRELTIATDQSALLRLPWELMADEAGSLAQHVSVRRQLAEPEDTTTKEAELPLRMLYIVSRPHDAGFIDPRVTTRSLFAAIDPLGTTIKVEFCRPPTLARMEEMLDEARDRGEPFDVVHFDGHGDFLPESEIGGLCFEKPDDGKGESQTDLVTADRLGKSFGRHHVPLVVLEACRSATVGRTVVFRSVAPRLIQAGVGSVLSMSHAVHVEAARILLDRFYHELVRGKTIGHAVAAGRKALRKSRARWIESGPRGRTVALQDWFLPHLYQRGPDEPLLPPPPEEPVRLFDLFLSHSNNDSARVEALARRLADTHGLRVWLDKWEVGMGDLRKACAGAIRNSRFTLLMLSPEAIGSDWVKWETEQTRLRDPDLGTLLPVKLSECDVPADLGELLWVDMRAEGSEPEAARRIADLLAEADLSLGRRFRNFRSPAEPGQPGGFPRPPRFGFHGRARELYELERALRRHRGIVLHAMGGMGKTTLATEAAHWWTRSGLFRDGACFVSFEQFTSADRVVQVLGEYCEGPRFHQRPASEQRRRAIEFFQEQAVLLVWDNYESALPQFNTPASGKALAALEQATPYIDEERRRLADLFADLTSGTGKGCVLVTCRPGETQLPDPLRFELHGLARADSLWLLNRILQRDGLSLDDERLARERLDPLLDDLADHPLSLELVGPHLKQLTPEEIRADFGRLLTTLQQDADETRNQSLLASLEFSRRHLSPPAREALRWLGLFSGGVFESNLLNVSQKSRPDQAERSSGATTPDQPTMPEQRSARSGLPLPLDPAAWEAIRGELQAIALLRIEDDFNIPFLRFHPTLAIASADRALAEDPATRERYVQVYLAVMQMLDKMLTGSQSRAALEILSREEANYRRAVRWAVADNQHQAAARLGHTFSRYLQRSGRLRERDAWVEWLHGEVTAAGFTKEAAAYERQQAWTRLTSGDPQGAVDQLQQLIERLRQTTEFDPAFELATATLTLGRVLQAAGASAQAIPVLHEAIGHWETLVEKTAGQPWEELVGQDRNPSKPEASARDKTGDTVSLADASGFDSYSTALGNLSATMGDLANALSATGDHDEALAVAEQCLTIQQACGNQREVAAGHTRSAQFLMASGRYDEADARYDQALAAARRAGDKELEGSTLQHQGILALQRNQLTRATGLYQQALQRFQEAGNPGAMMLIYNNLGVADRKAGRLAEARAWYEKSRELAEQLQDQVGLGQAAQNIGIVCQEEGEAARAAGDESTARQSFEQARRFVEESLAACEAQQNKPYKAESHGQLARIHLLLGDLDSAERHAHAAREIHESLGLKEVHFNYNTLSEIAQARGDTTAAAEWAQKRDDKLQQLEQLAGGGGLPAQLLRACQALLLACARAGFAGEDLGPAEQEGLAQLAQLPDPFPDFAAFLHQVAAGKLPPIPASLPAELRQIIEPLVQAIQDEA